MSSQYQTLKVEFLKDNTIAKVYISRPKVLNAMNPKFFQEIERIFTSFNNAQNLRVVVLLAEGKLFTSGLDLREYASLFSTDISDTDPARFSTKMYQTIRDMQRTFLAVFDCRVPVLVGVHGKCIGGGVDLTSMCDVRYCTSDAQFSIKQIDIGMAADLGTLQFLINNTGNQSTFRELAYTGRMIKAQQAKQIGMVTRILPTREELEKQIMRVAEDIASKSPVGIHAIKQLIKRQYRKKVDDSLEYIARLNSVMLQTKDTTEAITAFLQKRKPNFPKL